MPKAAVGVIGGSGLYEFLDEVESVTLDTPYGPHSPGLTTGTLTGRMVAFIPRHGSKHELPPHLINYRANIWALRRLGVSQILAPCAVGSLQTHLQPGSFVVPDQIVDRTGMRKNTFITSGVAHVSFADPYCPTGRGVVLKAANECGIEAADGAAMVVIDGPRFSTRAESRWYSDSGWDLVNMTGQPEAVLAREMAACYTAIALVTDMDAGLAREESVTQFDALATFSENIDRLRELLQRSLSALPDEPDCSCLGALDGMAVTHVPDSLRTP
ncbi:MAG: S-methyl-5'-thioadenosine phosphorylase [Candidatus Nanopelagicales bacterium]